MLNLFGFESQTFDPYAGMSEHKKLKKMVSKANIRLLLSKDKGFMKQKGLQSKTKVMISNTGANVNQAYAQPVTTAFNNNGKTASIAVNSAEILPALEEIDVSKHQDFTTDSLSMSYNMLANKKSATGELLETSSKPTHVVVEELLADGAGTKKVNKKVDPIISQVYKGFAMSARTLAAASVSSGGLPDMNKYIKSEVIDQGTRIGDFIQALTKNVPAHFPIVQTIINDMKRAHRSQSAANGIVNRVNNLVEEDIKTCSTTLSSDEQLKDSHHPLVPMFNIVNSNSSHDKDKKSDNQANVGQGELENAPEEDLTGLRPNDKVFEETQDTMEFDEQNDSSKHKFFRDPTGDRYRESEGINANAMEKLADELYESLKGRMGRLAGLMPSKRLSKRNIASGLTDKIYMSTTEEKGKFLNVNIIIDTSGSMSGQYIKDAKEVTYVMNILAERGIFKGNVILTGSSAHALIPMPMPRDRVNHIGANGGGEGIRECFRKFKPEMKSADFNICLTDGMLSDGHIDKDEMTRQNISITGGYVTGTKDTILEFSGSLNRWFHKSFVRPTTKELILALVAQGVFHTKGN